MPTASPQGLRVKKSERTVDALAVKKYQSLTDSLSDNLKSRNASASKKGPVSIFELFGPQHLSH